MLQYKEVGMPDIKKMTCPDCGVEMNRHAEKINYTAALTESCAADPDIGAVVKEAHTCPQCGQTVMKSAN